MDTDVFPLEGGCTCRAVRFRMMSKPLFVHCCHCTWCQRETGTAFALNAMIESDRVVLLSGDVEAVHTPSNSGKGQKITRCAQCRIAVWSNYAGAGEAIRFVRVGTLDQAFPPRPRHSHLHVDETALGDSAEGRDGRGGILRSQGVLAGGKHQATRSAAR